MEASAAEPDLTTARPPGRRPRRLALLSVAIAVQGCAAVFFSADVAADLLFETGEGDGNELAHNTIELIAAAALTLGVGVLWRELRRLRERHARMADQLRVARGAFHDLLESRFDDWGLTPSERDVALLLVKGLTLAEIATVRGSAEGTIKAHCNKVYAKAGVSGRTELVSLFLEDLMAGEIAT